MVIDMQYIKMNISNVVAESLSLLSGPEFDMLSLYITGVLQDGVLFGYRWATQICSSNIIICWLCGSHYWDFCFDRGNGGE